ncbi:MAG TPA: ATP-binding protein [Planctomycetia bacterium]|jgi:AAA+ ATPase superfamily predicted ATPase|nr:ATP-binding protein [Planctomycetia bacterium]
MAEWKFYGRTEQLQGLERMLARRRWFFAKVTGRRRIGKTALVRQAMRKIGDSRPIFYVQIPDSEPPGVLSAVNDALDTFQVPVDRFARPNDLLQLAKMLEAMSASGYIAILDEFQYFHRKGYEEFCSHLQAAADRLAANPEPAPGGWIVLGSIHTEMAALLEDRGAPLYQRTTDDIDLGHLDIASVLAIIRDHGESTPERLLFLWSLFEGVPKFYRDCHEQEVLAADRRTLLRRIFFESSSPLRSEAENWFLRELRGRYDVVLKVVARNPGRTHKELVQAIRAASGSSDTQIGGYLKVLIDRYGLLERKLPVFAKPEAKRGRYYVADNFLRAWLAALANPVSALAFRPLDDLIKEADQRLADVEGGSLEKLAGNLYEERSRKGIGDFPLTRRVQGYWDRGDVEIDLVAVNEPDQAIRFGSCKRSPKALLADVNNFKGHVGRFLEAMPRYEKWRKEYVGIAPTLDGEQRAILAGHDVIPQDLRDLTEGMD